MSELYIGIMSGTSLDGVDAVLADFCAPRMRVLAHSSAAMPTDLRAELLALNTPGANELHRAALAANALARLYAAQAQAVLQQSGVARTAVVAVGVHGQTVRHRPGEFDGTGYTLQLNNPALVAELCGMDVVADLRSRDVAAGGQGAPLVPPFHHAWFGAHGTARGVLNIGGISNLTALPGTLEGVMGFDCGPGNALMDYWCQLHTGQAFDAQGNWAASGAVHAGLLATLLQEPYFSRPAPKSTGRDLFNPDWLQSHLQAFVGLPAKDVQATLTELTARCCASSLLAHMPQCQTLIVCGGGALNTHLMLRLQAALPGVAVESSEKYMLPPLQVEATAFAWLARQTVLRKAGNLPQVTGCAGPRVLGAIYPASDGEG